ncbi:DUF7346 family protein [Halorubrum vacuolatum]|uniref:HTH arsR-type domain-containing protein n=1 Tax=Halorubrum vacuolatum TaxID=63740 RepID=A0A238X805_HALVU|nr:hypothetical protein [Halorubrum vacuolatum]SNR53969.1 hypothetical protein SAMN06264855_11371 [Halorubrum vacuolatum]
MRTVRDADGTRYLLVKRSGESSRVRDPETGAERYVANADLEAIEGESVLETAAAGVPTATRRAIRALHDDRTLGLLVILVDEGPFSVLELMDGLDMCESDLHGRLAEFQAAGLIREVDVIGRRGYEPTETAVEVVDRLRG